MRDEKGRGHQVPLSQRPEDRRGPVRLTLASSKEGMRPGIRVMAQNLGPGRFPQPTHLCAGADGVTSVAVAGGEGLAGYGQRRAASSSVPSVVDPGQQALCPLAPHRDP